MKKITQDPDQGMGNRPLQQGDIVNDPGDQLTGGPFLEKAQVEPVEVGVDPVAQVTDHALAHPFQEIGVDEVDHALEQKEQEQGERQQVEQPGVLVDKDLVQKRLDHVGLGRVEPGNHHHAHHGDDQLAQVWTQDAIQAGDDFPVAHALQPFSYFGAAVDTTSPG